MKKNILISVSGGRTSGFMAVYLKELYKNENLLFLYANTGKEKQETLDFLNQLDTYFDLGIVWLEAKVNPVKGKGTTYKVVDYENCSKNGEPFTDVIKKYGLPSKLFRHCTRELKEAPIHKYAKAYFKSLELGTTIETYEDIISSTGNDLIDALLKIIDKELYNNKVEYLTAIGIRADEKHRLTQKENYIYPLAELNFDKTFINNWWKKQPFDLQLREHEGNCDFCFLKSKKKRIKLLREGLDVSWWNDIEETYSTDRQPITDVRNDLSIEDLININNDMNLQVSMLDDVDFDCFCKAN